MKRLMTIFGLMLISSLILTSCGNASKDAKEETKKDESTNKSADASKENEKTDDEPKEIEAANISCKLYFKGFDFTDEESGEMIKGTVAERENFSTKKAYTFCYDSESFEKLTITGTGNNLSFTVKDGNKQIFKKENIELKDKLTFTSKDFNFDMAKTYSIVVKQDDKVLFNGKIDSQGCM
jgi:hypothetical protein